jgi:ABC-2 type transport system ATP-binding protein
MEPVLEADRLTKRYAGRPAVRDVSFAIRPGEVLGYLGPNGSGKSTTVKMLTGLLAPTGGRTLYRGRNIHDDLAAYKRNLGYVPEEANLYTHLTGWEYLELVGTLRGLDRRRFTEKMEALLEDFTLYRHRHSPISSYSKGMRQRILLIAALLHDPEILILDEPFSGLDVTFALVFRKVLGRLAEAGKAVFFCSPVLEVVEKVCSHLIVLRQGEVAAYGSLEEIRRSTSLSALEDTFLRLTEQADAERIADDIFAAVHAPCR